MLEHDLDTDAGVLVVTPAAPLAAEDFATLAAEVDPYLDAQGALRGLLVDARAFAGWEDLSALVSHLRFVRDHHHRIARVALVGDSTLARLVPRFAGHFVAAELRHFPGEEHAAALDWLGDEPAGD